MYFWCCMKSRPLRNILFSLLIVLWKFNGFHSLISVRYIVHNTGWGKRSPYLLIHVSHKSKLLKKEMYSSICLTHWKIYHLSFLINNFIKTCSLQEKNHLVLYKDSFLLISVMHTSIIIEFHFNSDFWKILAKWRCKQNFWGTWRKPHGGCMYFILKN